MERDGGLSVTEADGGGQMIRRTIRWPMHGLGAVLILALVAAGSIGWVLNIIKIAEADAFTPFVILRCVGAIVVFLGAVLGWIG